MNLAGTEVGELFYRRLGARLRSLLTKVSHFLAEQDIKAYLVGGLVRDVLLGRETTDIDVAVAGNALEVASKVATAFGGRYVLLDREEGVGRVVLFGEKAQATKGRWYLDFSPFQDKIEQDLARRDFTINAMAVDLNQFTGDFVGFQLIDPSDGFADLQTGVIRLVSEVAFRRDAVRLLRAVRLAAELNFTIEPKTETLIQRDSHLMTTVAGERLREEFLRLLSVIGAERFLSYLDKLGLLMGVFPELVRAKGVKQSKEHFWDVFDHSLKVVAAVEFLLRQGTWEYTGEEVRVVVPWSAVLAQHFEREVSSGSTRGLLLKLAALLHDIAKPQTKVTEVGGRIRFLGHTQEGAALTASILARLRFSTKEIKLVETMVRYHLRPSQMSQRESPTRRAIYRYFRDTGETGIDILFLNLADHLATRGPSLDLAHWQEQAQLVSYVLAQRFQEESIVRPPKLVDGHDLIKHFGLSPGPKIGELLEVVREAQASGEVATREEALAYIRDCLLLRRE